MSQKYPVTEQTTLLSFLLKSLQGWSKKSVKQRLRGSSVLVNGKVQTQHDLVLFAGDEVQIDTIQHTRGSGRHHQPVKLEIIYQDKDLIAINKPAGLLSVGTAREKKQHALALLRTQLSRRKSSIRLWPVHRLDRETSGILLFATTKKMREAVMTHWEDTDKIYLSIVEGIPAPETATITQPLRLDAQAYHVHVGAHPDAKSAVTHYKVKERRHKRSLLEIRIETGRQHQIRAHMAWLGHSVVGDERYGHKGERMGLHAAQLHFVHPLTQKKVWLEVDAPRDFYALLEADNER